MYSSSLKVCRQLSILGQGLLLGSLVLCGCALIQADEWRPSPTPTVLHADEDNFDRHVLKADVPVLVDFYANWCGPCKRMAPTLDQLAAESPRARVVKVNVDDSPKLAARYGIRSLPSLVVFKNGRAVAKQEGFTAKSKLKAMLAL
jgi:thioredoxin